MRKTYSTRKTLIARIKDQYDEQAWQEFIEFYTRYIYSIIRQMRISEDDADEIHQKVMVKLWAKIPDLNTEEILRFRSYLATVTKNEVRQFIRSRTRRVERENKAYHDDSISYLQSIRLPEIDQIAEEEWRVHLTNLALKKVQTQFSRKAIEAFKLRIQGISYEEIAQRVGLTVGSVKKLTSRVKTSFYAEVEQLKQDLQ
ncbi:RNA polymerase sigma factor [Pontiella agarivorans]|nr:RNA polymerase sigma factor [Pontiella agarivorans]